jgi:hypothetical protein
VLQAHRKVGIMYVNRRLGLDPNVRHDDVAIARGVRDRDEVAVGAAARRIRPARAEAEDRVEQVRPVNGQLHAATCLMSGPPPPQDGYRRADQEVREWQLSLRLGPGLGPEAAKNADADERT